MELNEDGLIPGQPVDFETLMRFKAKQAKPVPVVDEQPNEEPKPKPRRSKVNAGV